IDQLAQPNTQSTRFSGAPVFPILKLGILRRASSTGNPRMDLAELVVLGIKISIVLIVFGLGLKSTPSDVVYLARRPALLARSLLSMNVITPLLAAAIVAAFSLKPAVEVALVVLSISPVPPILPIKQTRLSANKSYIYGLLFTEALLSIILIPLS